MIVQLDTPKPADGLASMAEAKQRSIKVFSFPIVSVVEISNELLSHFFTCPLRTLSKEFSHKQARFLSCFLDQDDL